MSQPAPLYTDAFQCAQWVLGHFDTHSSVLARSLCRHVLRLLTLVALAIKDRDRAASIEAADETLISLRCELRLAGAIGLLSDEQLLHVLGYADRIGRQLGGWQRALSEG